jgi:hypothetical protein
MANSRTEIGQYCVQHMIRRLNDTEAQLDPYPHYWTEQILPSEIFDRMLTELPELDLYDRSTDGDKHDGNRASMHLLSEKLTNLPEASQDLWFGIRLALSSPELKAAIFQKLSAGFVHRMRIREDEAADIEAFPRPMLFRETEGYSIAPHPDTRRKLATVQIALTDDPAQSNLGTSMYRLSVNPKDLLQTPRGFKEVKKYPFTGHSMFAFSVVNTVTMRSWHGRETLPAGCGIRNTLLQVYYADVKDANPEVLAEMKEMKKAA